MTYPSGLSAQLMTGEESTFGTPVTPDRGFEFIPPETLKADYGRIESQGLRAGQLMLRSDRWAAGKRHVAGDIKMELANKSFGRWFKHALGGVATSQPDAVGAPTVFKHTFTPAALPVGQTIQVGRPDTGGTVRPFTYHGCTISSWTLACAVDQYATLGVSVIGEDEDTSTALAAITYPASLALMTFVHGTLTVGGAAADISAVDLQMTNSLAEGRYFMGSALRKRPLGAGMRPATGKLTGEFESLTAYNRYTAGTEAELVLLFQGATISGAFKYETKVTANLRFDGETPNVTGPEILVQNLPFKVIDNTTTSIKVEYQTTDTLP